MFTAWRVYPSPTGTMGRTREMLPWESSTLLAMAKLFLKMVLMSSKDHCIQNDKSETR